MLSVIDRILIASTVLCVWCTIVVRADTIPVEVLDANLGVYSRY